MFFFVIPGLKVVWSPLSNALRHNHQPQRQCHGNAKKIKKLGVISLSVCVVLRKVMICHIMSWFEWKRNHEYGWIWYAMDCHGMPMYATMQTDANWHSCIIMYIYVLLFFVKMLPKFLFVLTGGLCKCHPGSVVKLLAGFFVITCNIM